MMSPSFNIKFFCLVFFYVSRWPCLHTAATIVNELPGFPGLLPFRLETGYVMVDKRTGTELFYYFVESESDPGKDPLLLWLTGGPGCSSFYGLYEEIGPMRFNRIRYNGTLPTLNYHPYTWTKIFNIIFLDWPAGTGFSFSEHFEYQMLDDYQSINQIHTFLKQWFVDHPNFLLNPFYVGGDSYGGKMAALVSHKIAQGIEAFDPPLINFKGYLIGNPRTGIDEFDINPRVAHAYELGIISHEFKELIDRHCVGEDYMLPRTALCTAHLKIFQKFLDEIVIDNILIPKCIQDNSTLEQNEGILRSLYEEDDEEPPISKSDLNCPDYTSYLASRWFDYYPIREALGVKKGSVKIWLACNLQLKKIYIENIHSSLDHHHSLLTRGYRALVYSGDHDLRFPTKGTLNWIDYLNFSVIEPWRSWKLNGQVGGYTILYSNNLTFATVMGGGHEAPRDKPRECWTILKRWISYESL
ncbi:Serine carboxypeptidase-like 19 [Dendrobium catenatum]|uniref:Serine carboxypeptidase-like 19 n=1 Tax=Dendrobium catenatum TaxID=906689 RepID=A0A2I0WFW4_9ASPA|nr:Serine carboxypeptidase-like 19 [Dendrobium catenatum]